MQNKPSSSILIASLREQREIALWREVLSSVMNFFY